MTPAIVELEGSGLTFRTVEFEHDPRTADYGAEAAAALGIPSEQIFKTLMARLADEEVVVAVVPVDSMLNMKAIAKAAGAKRATMADPTEAERRTGYVVGGISPFGQRQRHRTFVDSSAERLTEINVSGGRRGLEVVVDPAAFRVLLDAEFVDLTAG